MRILVTGAAGFIGHAIIKRLVSEQHDVVGIDNINTYYDIGIKFARLADLGIDSEDVSDGCPVQSRSFARFRFLRLDITDSDGMASLFGQEHFDCVINLAGQPGVRYSIENPYAYVQSNVVGFLNLLENCRHHPVRHFLYASSSSVYGDNTNVPFSETMPTDKPVSLYAATKKSDELMAYAYSRLYKIPATGLRFFTVYGPWGRPDMAPFLFMKSIIEGKKIRVFNNGHLSRDFTYIDDIVDGMMSVLTHPSDDAVPHRVYNIGHSSPVQLLDFISAIERVTGRQAVEEMTGMQPGDVHCTYADTTRISRDFGYRPHVSIDEGMKRFYEWYKDFSRPEKA